MPITYDNVPQSDNATPNEPNDRVLVCFERYVDAPLRWYSNIYKWCVQWLQSSTMVYSHVFVLIYSAAADEWYMLEVKYIMGERDNGIVVGTLIDEVIIVPSDVPNHPNVGLLCSQETELLMYHAIEVANPAPVGNYLLTAELMQAVDPINTWKFIQLLFTGDCEAYVCTDFVTTLLNCRLDFVTTPDMLYELGGHAFNA